jgi:hypothetical protein
MKIRQHFLGRQGYSLAELLSGLAVGTIILAVLSPTVFSLLDHTFAGAKRADLTMEGRWAIDFITRDLTHAHAPLLTPGTTGSSLSFTNPTGAITYSSVNNEICRQVGSSTARPITDAQRVTVSNATFTVNANNSVTVRLTVQGRAKDRNQTLWTSEYVETVFPKN